MSAPAAILQATPEQDAVPAIVLWRKPCHHVVAIFIDTEKSDPIHRALFLTNGFRRKLKAERTTVGAARQARWCGSACPHRPSVGGRQKGAR